LKGSANCWSNNQAVQRVNVARSDLVSLKAAVVGLLLVALYKPLWTSAIYSSADFGLGLVGFALLMFWRWPPSIVVVLSAAAGEILSRF
jgi:chromate transporter